MATRKTTSTRAPKFHYCCCCDKNKEEKEFRESRNEFLPYHRLTYCNSCIKEICRHYLTKTKSLEASVYFTCSVIGIPFIRSVYEAFEKNRVSKRMENELTTMKEYDYIGQYMSIMNQMDKLNVKNWNDFSDTDVALGDITKLRKSEESIEQEFENLRLLWGKDRTVDQIQYLEFRWQTYTEGKDLTDYQESQYRNLCSSELDIFEGIDVDNAVKRQSASANALGLNNFKIDKEKSLVEKMLESQIALLEQTEPAEYYKDLEKYADFMGIGNYWKNHVIRPMKNLLTGSKEYRIIPDEKKEDEV